VTLKITIIYNNQIGANLFITVLKFSDFKTNRTNYLRFDKAMSVSVSVYSSAELEIYLSDSDKFDYMKLQLSNERWTHLTIILHNNNVIHLKNNVLFRRKNGFKPTEIVFKSMNETYWKIHQCECSTLVTINTDRISSINF
jgi:hypothetical protein